MPYLIQTIIEKILFSDNSNVANRSSKIIIKGKDVGFSIDITGITVNEAEQVRARIITEINKIDTFEKINIVLTSSTNTFDNQGAQGKDTRIILENIDKVILVASGKGGVGKSTIAALIAQKLGSMGKKVGLLDADIYGPSMPNIFDINEKPKLEDKRMIPLEKYKVKINSIGFITDPEASISWRGPMVSKALYQLISLTKWGKLDYLIIDTPPGTGDIHLSLLQNYAISGVIMVTTPQKISAIDVERSINLYKKFSIPIIGIVENMSYYNAQIPIFYGNSGENIARNHNVPLLAKIPLNPLISECCDQGQSLKEHFYLIDNIISSLALQSKVKV